MFQKLGAIRFVFVFIVFGATATSAHAQLDRIAAITNEVEKGVAGRLVAGGRYVTGPELPGKPHPNCVELGLSSILLTNALVAEYAKKIKNSGAKILECDYPFVGKDSRRGWAIVVASDAALIAKRLVNACSAAARNAISDCARMLLRDGYIYPWGSNGFIYPITGFVREPCKGGTEGLIGFRDGVTSQYAEKGDASKKVEYCIERDTPISWQKKVGLEYPTKEVFAVGRIAALSRQEVEQAEMDVLPELKSRSSNDTDWFQTYVRANEVCAINSGYDRMMTIKAALLLNVKVPDRKACDG
jgi:hypothetical protein